MNAYTQYAAATKATPQTQRTPGRTDEVANSAGGFVFKVNDQQRLERFLILGSEGGTFYAGQTALTEQNAAVVTEQVQASVASERNVVDTIVDVSVNARAYKQSPALFALAIVFAVGQDKAYATAAFNKVVRTSTHLFEFCGYLDTLSGWGRAKRRAVAGFYDRKEDALATQLAKYRQRKGFTHRDVLRLSHATGLSDANAAFALRGEVREDASVVLKDYEALQAAGTAAEVVGILQRGNATWEMVPTQFLKDADVWKSLFYSGKLQGQALVRNITRLARIEAFKDMSFAADYAERLTDEEMLRRTRLHPINLLNAAVVYEEGQAIRRAYSGWGVSRRRDWKTTARISDALNEAFHLSFKTIEPANKRTMIALDVSGSMSWEAAAGLDLSAAQVGAALSMTVARTEPAYDIMGFAHEFRDLGITPRMNLAAVMQKTGLGTFGGTDCALPMLYAAKNGIEVDTFVVVTDSETWAGPVKPHQSLRQYQDKMGIPAKVAVVGVTSTGFTIADPSMPEFMLDFVGFDASGPAVLTDFSAGRL